MGSVQLRKYVLHAEDINNGGKIPYHGPNGVEYIPFDGIWLEATDQEWNLENRALWKMTWGEFQGNTVEDRAKLDTIPGKENFGFTCDEDHGKYDWGNLSTDIWKGDKTDDPNPYPPDVTDPTKDPNKTDFATYDEYTEFTFVNPEDNGELVDFVFSVIYEISKEQAIKALDNLDICYGPIEVDNGGEIQETSTRITASDVKVSLALADEFYLGRDYENGQKE